MIFWLRKYNFYDLDPAFQGEIVRFKIFGFFAISRKQNVARTRNLTGFTGVPGHIEWIKNIGPGDQGLAPRGSGFLFGPELFQNRMIRLIQNLTSIHSQYRHWTFLTKISIYVKKLLSSRGLNIWIVYYVPFSEKSGHIATAIFSFFFPIFYFIYFLPNMKNWDISQTVGPIFTKFNRVCH